MGELTKIIDKLKRDDRFYFTTISGRKAKMLGYVHFMDEQSLNEIYEDLITFYGCKNSDFELGFYQQSQNYIIDFAIAKDCKTGRIFSFRE